MYLEVNDKEIINAFGNSSGSRIADGKLVLGTPIPEVLPIDWQVEYSKAKTISEKIEVLARRLGLISEE